MQKSLAYACTVWGSIGSVNAEGGTLIGKNRDENPKYVQELELITPKKGFRYFALAYKLHPKHKIYRFFSAGINEKGLVMVNTNATRHHKTHDNKMAGYIKDNILTRYDSVAAILNDQEKLFRQMEPIHLLIGDQHQIAVVEIGNDGLYEIKTRTEGVLYHTNHYTEPTLQKFNRDISEGTVVRYERIGALLGANEEKFTPETYKHFAQDHHNGDQNSILRKCTVATWVADLPLNSAPKLYVKLFDPLQEQQTLNFVLDQDFWNK